ncbi:uncharacterized protein LOC129586428 [Paramacrobiotus metropolitanus]|uniref:uncharacterized protein LOC129586428 n=1 Tax=Paramacrobiotus metropolitanus TaxID=2943436 RepID=UPI00244614F0|nr:uncharacterized protein LOC129586428 [Paramacrobiotus metropolitanus]XP_055335661.1 uncharacterized protein LOC129586428 [Paramacrobiotus metropolitanus]
MAATGEPSSSKQKSKYETWKELSVTDRLDRVGNSIQKVKDQPYALDSYTYEPKFGKGDPVAVCCQGYYYHAVVVNVEDEPYECPDLEKKVPLYRVKYPGWTSKDGNGEELIVEYDLIGTTKHTVAHELLYAHYWNKAKLSKEKKLKKAQQKSIFELPVRTLQKLETKWQQQIQQENPDQTVTFAQWVGVDNQQ